MPRPSKPAQATAAKTPKGASLEVLERACEAEAAKWNATSQTTRLDYETKARRLLGDGFAFQGITPATREFYKKAGMWVMRKQLKAILRAAKKAKKGETGKELFAVRQLMWAEKIEEAGKLLKKIQTLAAVDCKLDLEKNRMQASHKQKAATDADLVAFDAWAVKNSSFRDAFLVAEFSGCRGEEFGKGVKVQATKISGVQVLRFHIESAKCDGEKKGLDLRCIEVPFPTQAAESVQRRWLALAEIASENKSGALVTIAAKGKSTSGRRFTEACRSASEGAGVKIAAYGLRQRFSSQVKAASKGTPDAAINVALALGHQTTDTQEHYARAHRGGGAVSPVVIRGVNTMGVQIRGPAVRTGPPLHVKTRVALNKVTAVAAARGSGSGRPRL